jgi:hypothetical protein
LATQENKEIRRYESVEVRALLGLGMGIINAVFHSHGTVPEAKLSLKSLNSHIL